MAALGKPASRPAARARRTAANGESVVLSADAIVDAALELTEREGAGALTVRRLGRELGVDATAFYRHFRDKDELVLAVSDRIIAMTLDAVVESDDWRETLRSITSSSNATNLRYPAVTSITFARITGGRAERAMVELILTTISRAGLPPAETALYYRALVDAMLSLTGQAAAFANLEPALRKKDASAWTQVYGLLSRSEYPTTSAHAKELADLSEQDIFHAVIEAVIGAIESRTQASRSAPGKSTATRPVTRKTKPN